MGTTTPKGSRRLQEPEFADRWLVHKAICSTSSASGHQYTIASTRSSRRRNIPYVATGNHQISGDLGDVGVPWLGPDAISLAGLNCFLGRPAIHHASPQQSITSTLTAAVRCHGPTRARAPPYRCGSNCPHIDNLRILARDFTENGELE